jgi:hypothetical protein
MVWMKYRFTPVDLAFLAFGARRKIKKDNQWIVASTDGMAGPARGVRYPLVFAQTPGYRASYTR